MSASPRSRKLPQFGEYLAARTMPSAPGEKLTAVTLISLISAGVAGYFLQRTIGFWGWVIAILCIYPFVESATSAYIKSRQKPKSDAQLRMEEYCALHRRLFGYLNGSRLHRHIDPIPAALFEESARNWKRIRDTLEGTAWNSAHLPAHWAAIRDRSLSASDQAMEDLILLLKSSIKHQPNKQDWQDVFGEIVEGLLGRSVPLQSDGRFPAEYDSAREIAMNLNVLADEMETATKRLLKEDAVAQQFTSKESIDVVLGELRAIQDAEAELHEELRH